MKKLFNPGFELVFGIGLVAVFMLPLLVMAQENKELQVTISNNDTTINGKNIKELSADERKNALTRLNNLNHDFNLTVTEDRDTAKRVVVRMRNNGDQTQDIVIERRGMPGDVIATIPDMGNRFMFKSDSNGIVEMPGILRHGMPEPKVFRFPQGDDIPQVFNYRSGSPAIFSTNRKNSQSFNFAYTDKDGISTHLNFNAGDASTENVKRITGGEKADLEIKELNITPLFSSGKTNISFSLATAGAAEVTFKNTEGKILWSDKTANGSFTKSFDLLKNGVYYLQVKQGQKTGLKRITKEE
jgi:hypothetical protein